MTGLVLTQPVADYISLFLAAGLYFAASRKLMPGKNRATLISEEQPA
ncbi:hypothetical protein K7I13_07465 [Brucepastera parasyntrophica]|nr:hypothetical protein [Brucepastera parasyntrophica]ULQ61082.1 hypothetical protein K7I13_07465 [Brucepastera parasyntrophica]